jgi:acetyl esterase/lipase
MVQRPVANYQSLTHLVQLGGNPAVPKFKTQSGCINYNKRLIWANASDVGEYDIVADFGNNTSDAAAFQPNASFDQPLDIVDGYFVAGFRIVPDPTTDTSFAYYGGFSYTESTQGFRTVIDDSGSSVTVPMRAVVRFPADSAGATTPGQISALQANYPMLVVVHGAGHDFNNYDYLLEHWARNGFIAASIHLSSMQGTGRARILFEHLTILKNMFGAKAANNIGIMGHSRGGEAVVIAARLNNQDGLGHNIKAVISLAPTDQYTNESLGGAWATPYFVLYGAMDGDVAGGSGMPWNTGFALYDRASGAKKSMVFVYGATHDRFNLINPDVDITASWSKLGSTDLPKLLSAVTHQTIAKAYMTAFFRWHLKNESQWEGIFRGEWVPSAVTQAEGGKVKLYVQYNDTTITVVDNFEGPHSPTSWQVSTMGGSVDDGNTLPVDPVEDELYDVDAHSPHDSSGLLLRWDGTSDKLEFIPLNPINVNAFAAISFRVTQKVDSASNPVDQIQDLYLTLTDTNNKSRAVKVSKFGEIPPPQKRHYSQCTKSAMSTVRIPLHVFKIEVINTDKVDLQNVKALTFEFKAQQAGEIEIDSIEFTN